MTAKVTFKLVSKADASLPGVNQNKRKTSDSTQSTKKPKLSSVFDEEGTSNEQYSDPPPITYKRFPLTPDTLATFDRKMAPQNKQGVAAWQGIALSAGATSDHLRKDKIIKSTSTTPPPSSRTRTSRPSCHSSISSKSSESNSRRARGTRMTNSFILFWGGPLSNWNIGKRFSGRPAMDILVSRLDALHPMVPYPSRKRFATHLLCTHHFVCGEQFMMACKAWLFETELYELGRSEWGKLHDGEFEAIRHRLMISTQPDSIPEKAMWNSSLCRILRAHHPKDQKELGRHTPNFSEETWSRASMPIVIAGSIARAEADEDLNVMYMRNKDGKRRFAEGSPHDKIWGVGLLWNAKEIEDEGNWKGKNKLGRCHDEACRVFNGGDQKGMKEGWEVANVDGETEVPAPKSGW